MYVLIALVGAGIWGAAVLFVVVTCRVAAGSRRASLPDRCELPIPARGASPGRAAVDATAREAGALLTGHLLTAELTPAELLGGP